jgi:predicted phage-related endonuclease
MDRETWLGYRQDGIGASEIGAILGLDDYTSSLELYYYKIGDIPRLNLENIYMFMGRELEDYICDLWQYWDGTEQSLIENYRADRIVRRCRRLRAFVRNPAFPWLYCSLDRVINKYAGKEEGTLEAKNIGGFEMDKWEAGLPPKHVVQVQQQMLVAEFLHGEMALLQDGRRFHVLPFEGSAKIQDEIVRRSHDFWQRVLKGRKLVNEKYLAIQQFNQRRIDELNAAIEELAPEPDGTLAYANYLTERYKDPTLAERRGTIIEEQAAIEHATLGATIKGLEEERRKHESVLKSALADHQVLDFGRLGRVTWRKTRTGRMFRNDVKL